jgi:hypothetical protein
MKEKRKEQRKVIITRVPGPLAAMIERQAREQLLPTAAYVRQLLLYAASDGGPPCDYAIEK